MGGYSTSSSVKIISRSGYATGGGFVTDDFTASTYSTESFSFVTDNLFAGDAAASTIINNAIVGASKQFTISVWIKRTAAGATHIFFGRDNSTTAVRQFILLFNNTDKFQANFYTNSTNLISFTSTASFTETREWNNFVVVYDGTQAATSRVTVYRNGLVVAGSTSQTGTFTTINNTTANNIEIGGRTNAASFSATSINQVQFFSTNLSAANVTSLYNNRVPFDVRTNSTLNASLVLYLVADASATFSTNWTWVDLIGSSVFTSSGMVAGDRIADAPALKQISIVGTGGQSNDSGRTIMAELESQYTGSLSWLKVWNGTGYENIDSTLNNNQYSDTQSGNEFGIEFYLGGLLNLRYRKTIYIFKICQGGSYLANNSPSWSRNPVGAEFTQLTNDLIALKEWELSNGYTINQFRWIWIQGEADSLTESYANAYAASWEDWLAGAAGSVFDTKIQAAFFTYPFLYDCLLSANQTSPLLVYKSTVNAAKVTVQAIDPTYYRTIDTDAATTSEGVHYDRSGLHTVASAIYDKMILDGL